jgi:serine/threonine protein kinase
MTWISDSAIARIRAVVEWPDLSETRYDVIEEIGRGGMGAVYRAHDRQLDRDVAIKVCSWVGEPGQNRLTREAQVLAGLEHPGIVPVHEQGRLPDGRTYYVMRLVKGERLDERVKRLPLLADRLRLFDRLCDIVAFVHDRGVVHRDLKPSNIMVGAFGDVMVMDWGLAQRAPSDGDLVGHGGGQASGTEGYMAPEQLAGRADGRSDIYSLGIVLRDLTADAALATGRRARPLASIVARATASQAEDRYATVEAFAADVRQFADGGRVSAHDETLLERTGRLARTYRTPLALVIAYLIMRTLLLVWTR